MTTKEVKAKAEEINEKTVELLKYVRKNMADDGLTALMILLYAAVAVKFQMVSDKYKKLRPFKIAQHVIDDISEVVNAIVCGSLSKEEIEAWENYEDGDNED